MFRIVNGRVKCSSEFKKFYTTTGRNVSKSKYIFNGNLELSVCFSKFPSATQGIKIHPDYFFSFSGKNGADSIFDP